MAQIVALHGFLGSSQDWRLFQGRESSKTWGAPWQWTTPDLFSDPQLSPTDSPQKWAERFSLSQKDVDAAPGGRILLGYSMGGRLALHAALEAPTLWEAVVILSAHPGLKTDEERRVRRRDDLRRAEEFRLLPWEMLMATWETGPVFANEPFRFERREEDCDREALATSLEAWSLGNQRDLRDEIQKMECPVLWITGQRDQKYGALAADLTFRHSHSETIQIAGAGHRVAWADPEGFVQMLEGWIEKIKAEWPFTAGRG